MLGILERDVGIVQPNNTGVLKEEGGIDAANEKKGMLWERSTLVNGETEN